MHALATKVETGLTPKQVALFSKAKNYRSVNFRLDLYEAVRAENQLIETQIRDLVQKQNRLTAWLNQNR